MPILEAMASGCPVITSNVSACPEVGGNAALLVDRRNDDAILCAMRTIADDNHRREQLARDGLQRVQSFGWEASASNHLKTLRASSARGS